MLTGYAVIYTWAVPCCAEHTSLRKPNPMAACPELLTCKTDLCNWPAKQLTCETTAELTGTGNSSRARVLAAKAVLSWLQGAGWYREKETPDCPWEGFQGFSQQTTSTCTGFPTSAHRPNQGDAMVPRCPRASWKAQAALPSPELSQALTL